MKLMPAGVALMLFSGSKHRLTVPNPEEGRPGIRCTADGESVRIEAIGWDDQPTAQTALAEAVQILVDCGFDVSNPPTNPPLIYPTRVVSRKKVKPRSVEDVRAEQAADVAAAKQGLWSPRRRR